MPDLLPVALAYAARGLSVFALAEGAKVPPAGSSGCSDATTDPDAIRAMWERTPGAGIGVVPGPRYWVLDVDTEPPKAHPEGWTGHQALDELYSEGLVLPETPTAETPRGGLHLWWLATPGVEIRPRSTGLLVLGEWAGLDVRSVGSYVVAPPTRILVTKGERAGEWHGYRWVSRAPAVEAPEWLVDLVRVREEEPRAEPAPWVGRADLAERYARRVLETACETIAAGAGCRHQTWFKQAFLVGGYVGGGHLGLESARADLESAARRSLRPGERRGREITKTIADGLSAGSQRPVHPPTRER